MSSGKEDMTVTARIWRGGMIGAGAWSDVQLTAWKGVPNARIVALTDRHPERRNPVIERFGVDRGFDDFEAMLDQANLDFVDICTRPYSHASLTKLAADQGLSVLCQKPFCTNLEEAIDVVEYCRARDVRLMINENFRWQAWYRQIKAILDSGVLGRVFTATLRRRSRFTWPHFSNDQAYLAEMPRLAVYELGVHFLDTFRFLFGDPTIIFARLHHISPHMQGEDVEVITLGFSEMTGIINHSWASVMIPGLDKPDNANISELTQMPAPRLEIDGMAGTLFLRSDNSLHLYTDDDHQTWVFAANERPKAHIAAQQHFIDCLECGVSFETSGEDYLKTMGLVYAAYQSDQVGRSVTLI